MQDNVSVLIATILAVIIIVLFPVYNLATRQDSVANNMVVKATTNFVDEVRNQGYISSEDYNNFLNEIDATGNSYDVELEVYKPVFIETDEKDTYEEQYLVDYTSAVISKLNIETLNKVQSNIQVEESSVEDITDTVLDDDIYYLYEGYKFYVRVKNTNITQAQVLLDRLLGGNIKERIVVNYGGVVYTNEWQKGENVITSNANVSISRPMDYNLNEYKYELIDTIYQEIYRGSEDEEVIDEPEVLDKIYGIAVRLTDVKSNSNRINFIVKYDEILKLDGTKEEREAHIKEYFRIIGFGADVTVAETSNSENTIDGTWNYTYLISLDNIQYDFINNTYVKGKVQIKSGSANAKTGALSAITSEEFVVFYEKDVIEIEYARTPMKKDKNSGWIEDTGKHIFAEAVKVDISLNRSDEYVEEIKYGTSVSEVKENGISLKSSYNSDSKKYSFLWESDDSFSKEINWWNDIVKTGKISGKKYAVYVKYSSGTEKIETFEINATRSLRFELQYKNYNEEMFPEIDLGVSVKFKYGESSNNRNKYRKLSFHQKFPEISNYGSSSVKQPNYCVWKEDEDTDYQCWYIYDLENSYDVYKDSPIDVYVYITALRQTVNYWGNIRLALDVQLKIYLNLFGEETVLYDSDKLSVNYAKYLEDEKYYGLCWELCKSQNGLKFDSNFGLKKETIKNDKWRYLDY